MRLRRPAVVLAATVALLAPALPAHAGAHYTYLDPALTQDLYGTGVVPPGLLFGGVAFAPDGSPLVNECRKWGSPLHKFDATTLLPTLHGTSTLHAHSTLPSDAGCGMTNHPDGAIYSNTINGVTRLDATTGAHLTTIGLSGSSYGIAVDPRNHDLVYMGGGCTDTNAGPCTVYRTDPVTNVTTTFATVPAAVSTYVDGIAFDPTGRYLFLATRKVLNQWAFRLTVLDRNGLVVQNVVLPREPDGITFSATAPRYVLVNDTAGALDRLDFPNDDYALPPLISVAASGGFRGDLSQVGADGCVYVTQAGVRYDDGTVVNHPTNSLVRVCGGFAPSPGVGHLTGRAFALSVGTPLLTQTFADTGYVWTGVPMSTDANVVSVAPHPKVRAGVLNGHVHTTAFSSYAEASVADVVIGPLRARGIVADSWSDCSASGGDATISYLEIGGVTTGMSTPAQPTVITTQWGTVTLNEQLVSYPYPGARVHTVNALHVDFPSLGIDVVVSSATSDVHGC